MANFVSEAAQLVNASTLWGAVTGALPLIAGVLTFVIGFTVVKKVLKGGSKGKLRI